MPGFAILEVVLMPFGLFVIGAIFLSFAVRRVRKKLDPANKPTLRQYINELGGYAVLAAVLLLYAVIVLIAAIASVF